VPTIEIEIEIYASRGDCWVSAHKGSESGAALMERVLRQGETVKLRGRRIWLQLGAAGNVDVTVDGKDRQIPSGTTTVELG
jgi:sulfate adenylyltransferase subunit 1 (EFTu-like GTPase family)